VGFALSCVRGDDSSAYYDAVNGLAETLLEIIALGLRLQRNDLQTIHRQTHVRSALPQLP